MIEIKNLTKTYGSFTALNDISFSVPDGQILGFLGRNGAGKTTTMNIITGYLSSTAGSVCINGIDILKNPKQAKRQIGYLPETPPLYPDMTVKEYIRFVCELKQVAKKEIPAQIDYVFHMANITDVQHRLIANLSKGYKQRVGLAQALVGNPDIIILDEPTVGLDPKQIIEIRNTIKQLGEQHTVILSSHILHEIADVCNHVIIINHGTIVADDSLQNLGSYANNQNRLRIRVLGSEREVDSMLRSIEGLNSSEALGSFEPDTVDFLLQSDVATDLRAAVFSACASSSLPLLEQRNVNISLEDIFLQLTGDSGEGGKAV